MHIHHIRNATSLVSVGEHHLLIDPMYAAPGSMPSFRLRGGERRRNPLVPLPASAERAFESATAVVITHEHPDHLDPEALAWTRDRGLPVWASAVDAPNLRRKGLPVTTIEDRVAGIPAQVIPGRHGRGPIGWLMGPVSGLYLAPEAAAEPSLYITSDTVLTTRVQSALTELRPDVVLAPAGAADFGFGGAVIFPPDELSALMGQVADEIIGELVFDHVEALDHCPTRRSWLRERAAEHGVQDRVHVPDDGARIALRAGRGPSEVRVPPDERTPGFQKWLTSKIAGT